MPEKKAMLERTASDEVATAKPPALLARRLLFVALVGLTIAGMVWLTAVALSPGGLGTRDPVAAVTPAAAGVRGDEPITASTAILMCIRNEPPERAARYLAPLVDGL